ncbi:unnamed protein product, partial [Amoebophrya sp. A25]|eukprot:GSA25T00023100001.1
MLDLSKPVLRLDLALRPGPFLRRRMPNLPKSVVRELNTVVRRDSRLDGPTGEFDWRRFEIHFKKL